MEWWSWVLVSLSVFAALAVSGGLLLFKCFIDEIVAEMEAEEEVLDETIEGCRLA